MRSGWVNGALVAAAVAVGAFTVAAFQAPTQTPPPSAGSSPSPLPSLTSTVGAAGHSHHVVIIKKHPTKTPDKKPHHKRKHPTAPTYTPPAYTPPAQPTSAPQPTPAPILPTLPGGGGTQIPVPP